jgi:N-acyl-D-amino-acid deacylase
LKLQRRGELKTGNYADVVVFDPKTVRDHASFENLGSFRPVWQVFETV